MTRKMDIISGQKVYPKNYHCNNLTRNDLKISFRKTWKHFKKIFEIVDKEKSLLWSVFLGRQQIYFLSDSDPRCKGVMGISVVVVVL